MPRIDEESASVKRPFKKKPYRPWHLLDEFEIPLKKESNVESINQEKDTNNEPSSNHSNTIKEAVSNHKEVKYTALVTKMEPFVNQTSNPISNQIVEMEAPITPQFFYEKNANDIIQRVSGLQRKILFYIVQDCILKGTLYSSPITTETLKLLTNADTDTVKTATQRLVNKNLISRGYGKKGKGGFAIFHIQEDIRNAVIEAQKREGGSHQLVTNWLTNKESISTYSSGSINNTTTKDQENSSFGISESKSSWDLIDIEPLSNIGFTKSHLRQIILDNKLDPEIVQDSLYAFAFDLEKNNKIKYLKSTPLNYFMGILRSGKPYAPPANYECPEEIAMRIYLEKKREINAKRQAIEDALFQEAYHEWEMSLSQQEKESILPDPIKITKLYSDKIAYLRSYFKEKFWLSIKNQYVAQAMGKS